MGHKIIDVAPDGKMDIVEGVESLKKDPKKKKKADLKSRWGSLKKALNHSSAFMDVSEAIKPEEKEDEDKEMPGQPPMQQPQSMEPEVQQGDEDERDDGQDQVDDEQSPEPGVPKPEAPSGQAPDEAAPEPEQEASAEQAPEAQEEIDQGQDAAAQEEDLIQKLRENGYSDAEIAYIVHGHHAPAQDKAKNIRADKDMAAAMFDHLHSEMDTHHKQRLLDLDHEGKKHEIDARRRLHELDVDYKAKENALKLEHMKDKHRQYMAMAAKKHRDSDE